MTRVELACRRYADIVGRDAAERGGLLQRELRVWLRDDVCQAIDEYWRRPAFRECVRWPLVALAPGAETPERGRVERVDAALVGCARAVLAVAEDAAVWAGAVRRNPPRLRVVEQTVLVTGTAPPRQLDARRAPVDELAHLRARVERIGRRDWSDLVCVEDFLHPVGGWMPADGRPDAGPAGEFNPWLNPELHPVGDYVTGCLLRRVELMAEDVGRFQRILYIAASGTGRAAMGAVATATEAWNELDRAVGELRSAVAFGERGRLRDSCVALTQVYVGLHPTPDTGWLGLRPEVVRFGRTHYARLLARASPAHVFDRIATALADLHRLYAGRPPAASPVEEAIAGGGLVLTDEPAAYWGNARLDVDWSKHRTSRRLLRLLAQAAAAGGYLANTDVYDKEVSEATFANAISRLRGLLPNDLRCLIRPGPEPQTYRLDVPRSRIQIIVAQPLLAE